MSSHSASSAPEPPSGERTARSPSAVRVMAVVLFFVAPFYLTRLLQGVDFTDEGYTLAMLVSWLRSSPEEVGNLSFHQIPTAVLYPLVRAYSWLQPDLTGLAARSSYRLEIVDQTGHALRQATLVPAQAGVSVPGLDAGQYFVRVYLPEGELLREYGLQIHQ